MKLNFLFSAGIILSLFCLSNQKCHMKFWGWICDSVTNLTDELLEMSIRGPWTNVTIVHSNLTITSKNYVNTMLMNKLTFKHCIIDTIGSNAFQGDEILILVLEDNEIRHLHPFAFFLSQSLLLLNLRNNYLTHIEKGVFSGLSLLTDLDLAENDIRSIEGLQDLLNLRNLDFSYNYNLQLKFLDDLKKLPRLQRIYASYCNLTIVPSELSEFKSLDTIELIGNNLKALSGNDFPSSLMTLIASKNSLMYIDNNWQNFQQLDLLDLSSNLLLPQSNSWETLTNLFRLFLDNTTIDETFLKNKLNNLKKLSWIKLNKNKFTKFDCEIFENNKDLNTISIAANNIRSIVNIEKCPKNIYSFNINSNKLKSLQPFSQLSNLIFLDVGNNELDIIDCDIFYNLTQLEYLYLQYNNIETLPTGCFQNLTKLVTLDIQHNLISYLNRKVFSGLQSLKTLSLAYNRLKAIDEEVFSTLKNLKDLDLSGNKLKNFDITIIAFCESPLSFITNLDDNEYNCSTLEQIMSRETHFIYGNTFNESNMNGIRCNNGSINASYSSVSTLHDQIISWGPMLGVILVITALFGVGIRIFKNICVNK